MAKIGNLIVLPSDIYYGEASMAYCLAQDAVYVWSQAGYVGVIGVGFDGDKLVRNQRADWPIDVIGIDTEYVSKGVTAYGEERLRWLEYDTFAGRAFTPQREIGTPAQFDGFAARTILFNTDRDEIDIYVQSSPAKLNGPYGFIILNSKTYEYDRYIDLSLASVHGKPSTAPVLNKNGKISIGYGFGPDTGEINSTLVCVDANTDQIYATYRMPNVGGSSSLISGICVDNSRGIIYVLSSGELDGSNDVKTVVFVFDISNGVNLIAQSAEIPGALYSPVFDHSNGLIYCCKNGLAADIVTIDVNGLVVVNTIRFENLYAQQICSLVRSGKIGVLFSNAPVFTDALNWTFVTIDQPGVPIGPEVGH